MVFVQVAETTRSALKRKDGTKGGDIAPQSGGTQAVSGTAGTPPGSSPGPPHTVHHTCMHAIGKRSAGNTLFGIIFFLLLATLTELNLRVQLSKKENNLGCNKVQTNELN